MQAIYEPKGAAREYAPYAMNLYRGCSHGCIYCYAPACLRMTRREFSSVTPRGGILEALEKQLSKWIPPKTVLLCFTCDPYQDCEQEFRITRQALELMDGKVPSVAVLTKGTLVSRDFDIIAKNNWTIGATLSCFSEEMALEFEPHAAFPVNRIAMLRDAEKNGIKTFVSIEPVISVDEMNMVLENISDLKLENGVRIGKWNHDKEANMIDWKSVLQIAVKFGNTKKVYIKNELAKYGDPPQELRKMFFE